MVNDNPITSMENEGEVLSFEDALSALSKTSGNLPDLNLLASFSGLTSAQFEKLQTITSQFDAISQRVLMQTLADLSESNYELDFTIIAKGNLDSADGAVRQAAIEILVEDRSSEHMAFLVKSAKSDPELDVRVEATRNLGRFILAGELGQISEHLMSQAQETVLSIIANKDEDVMVRRQAIEAIAYSSHKLVPQIITEAYADDEEWIRISAVAAMGHTCDNRWDSIVFNELDSDNELMQIESVRASGELQLHESVSRLASLIDVENRDITDVVIWSLGEIGGKEASRILENLAEFAEESEDDELFDLIDEALANASLVDGDDLFGFYDYEDEIN